MELLGYAAALFIGISLGLIGGGGSILTVPVLVYLFGLSPSIATSYSLFIVGITSLAGAVTNFRKGWVDIRTGLLFAITSIIAVILTRQWLLPLMPDSFLVAGVLFHFSSITMIAFALLMITASFSMIRPRVPEAQEKSTGWGTLTLYGIGIGFITGFLGAGGGFLLIPALVLLLKLPVRTAIGTSLFIITLNSLVGFSADILSYQPDWKLLILLSGIAILGVVTGSLLGRRIEPGRLRQGFGWFILLMGIYIIIRETVLP